MRAVAVFARAIAVAAAASAKPTRTTAPTGVPPSDKLNNEEEEEKKRRREGKRKEENSHLGTPFPFCCSFNVVRSTSVRVLHTPKQRLVMANRKEAVRRGLYKRDCRHRQRERGEGRGRAPHTDRVRE